MTHLTATESQQRSGQVRDAWDAIADGYDRVVTPTNLTLGNTAIDYLDFRPGVRFLDVAAGSGALSIAAAQRVATVLGTDISPRMIEHLNAHARQLGLDNIEGRVMDGHNLDLDDDSFDASGSMFGVMLFPDLPRGLREMARVTKSGGQVLMIAFGPPQNVEFLRFMLGAAQQVVPDFAGLPMDPPPLPFQVSDPDRLRDAMTDVGLRDVRVDRIDAQQEYESGAQLWDWVASSNPIGSALTASMSPDQGESVRKVLDDILQERAGTNGIATLTNAVSIGIGIV